MKRDRIRNSEILGILNEVPVTEMIEWRELRLFGHLIRIVNNSLGAYGKGKLRGCG
jgi:hypothetical protein